jgi:hypothetical protein
MLKISSLIGYGTALLGFLFLFEKNYIYNRKNDMCTYLKPKVQVFSHTPSPKALALGLVCLHLNYIMM